MNNNEVHQAISKGAPLFYWLHLEHGEQYLIPFICQRCGSCCRMLVIDFFEEGSCGYFKEPNICTIYDKRPRNCRTYPIYNGFLFAEIICQGYQLSKEAISRLSQGVIYRTGFESGDEFTPSTKLHKAVAGLGKGNLPKDFIDRFVELNSLDFS